MIGDPPSLVGESKIMFAVPLPVAVAKTMFGAVANPTPAKPSPRADPFAKVESNGIMQTSSVPQGR
jgi:hypothetical protein